MASEMDGLSLNRLLLTQGSPAKPSDQPIEPRSQLLLMPNGPAEEPSSQQQQKTERRIDDVFKQYARQTSLDGPVENTISQTRATLPKNVRVNPPVPALVTQTSSASIFSNSSGSSSSGSKSFSTPNGPVRSETEEKVSLRKANSTTESSAPSQRQKQRSQALNSTAAAPRPQPSAPPSESLSSRRQTLPDIADDMELQKLLGRKPDAAVAAYIIAPTSGRRGFDGNQSEVRSIAQLSQRSRAPVPAGPTYGSATAGRTAHANQPEKSGRRGSEPDIHKCSELQKYVMAFKQL